MKRTPLRRTARLQSRTPLRRSWLRAKRPDPEKRVRQEAFRQAVTAVAGGRCQAPTPDCPPYPHPGVMVHHVLPRSAGGDDHPDNGLLVCAGAHRWIHANPAASYDAGWLKKRGLPAEEHKE